MNSRLDPRIAQESLGCPCWSKGAFSQAQKVVRAYSLGPRPIRTAYSLGPRPKTLRRLTLMEVPKPVELRPLTDLADGVLDFAGLPYLTCKPMATGQKSAKDCDHRTFLEE